MPSVGLRPSAFRRLGTAAVQYVLIGSVTGMAVIAALSRLRADFAAVFDRITGSL